MAKYLDMTGLTYLISKLIALINAKSDKNHTHNYAGSSSAGGNAIDSDKLDGYHADSFVLLSNFIAGNLGSKAVYYSVETNKDCNDIEEFLALAGGVDGLHYPTTNTYYYILTLKYSSSAKKQLAFGYKGTAANNILFRTWIDNAWSEWKKINDSGNADTLDNYHASNFVKTSGRNTIDADSDNSTYGRGALTLQNETSGLKDVYPTLAFCQKGISDANLCMNNREFYRKTSTDSNYYKLYDSGNLTCGTSALTPGSSSLTTGNIYLQYE